MNVCTTTQPQTLKVTPYSTFTRIELIDEVTNEVVNVTNFTISDAQYCKFVVVNLDLIDGHIYTTKFYLNNTLVCFDRLTCTNGNSNTFTQRVTTNDFITYE